MRGLLLVVSVISTLQAGRIVVHNDEWVFSNFGYSQAGNGPTSTYAQNVANYFTGGVAGDFLVYSNNFGLNESDQVTAVTAGGHTITISTAMAFTAANLSAYDAVFLAGNTPGFNTAEAAAYVNAGGNIYIAAGTSQGFDAASEAAFWNPFLNLFGMQLAPVYNHILGVLPVSSSHPLLAGVTQFYQNNGNSVSLFGLNPSTSIILSQGDQGLIGVYAPPQQEEPEVPEPSTYLMLAGGLGALSLFRRFRR
jgi:hypothetical protein